MMPALRTAGLAVLLSAGAFGQPSSNVPGFEVASVRPSVPRPPAAGGVGARSGGGGGGCALRLKLDRDRVTIECAFLPMLIGYAFRLPPDRIIGPDWMTGPGSPRFDIAANIPRSASEDQVPEMLQALLSDRFKLAVHRGTTIQTVYALVVTKGGMTVKEASPDAGVQVPPGAAKADTPSGITGFFGETLEHTTPNASGSGETTTISNPRMGTVRETDRPNLFQRMEAPSITFEGLAELLDKMMPSSTSVIDMTGLKGRYQLVLEVSLNDLPRALSA